MADIRIKDLATTASSAASDDFMALDGAINGTRKMSAANPSVTTLTTSGVITPGGSVHGANGSAANPSFAFNSNQNTGLYRIGANNIGVAANGAKVLDIATTGLTVTGALGASSLTSPAANALTLAGGSSGASLVLGQGANASTVFTGTGTGLLSFTKTTGNPTIRAIAPAGGSGVFEAYTPSTSMLSVYGLFSVIEGNGNKWENGFYGTLDYVHRYNSSEKWRFTTTGNLLIGGTTDITGSGGLKVFGTTAGSSGAGALVVAGGLATGGASYFGGAVTVKGAGRFVNTFNDTAGGYSTGFSFGGNDGGATTRGVSLGFIDGSAYHNWASYSSYLTLGVGTTEFGIMSTTTNGLAPDADGTMLFKIQRATGAATFAGAVTVSSTTAGSSGAGALVVAGGLATGAASYIGGALTLAGTGLSATNASGSVEFSGSRSSTGGGVTVTYKTGATTNWFHGLRGLVDNNWYLFNDGTSTNTLIFNYSTNAATFAGLIFPQQAVTASAPTYVKGAIYFDTTLNKLRVGGATGWETITSV